MMATGGPAVLDTDVLIHLARDDSTGKSIEAEHALSTWPDLPILSSVVEAEVRAIAQFNEWGGDKLDRLDAQLSRLNRVDAGSPEVVDAYIDLYCAARSRGRYKEFRQNDLWLAATAVATGAMIFTCNGRDFEWLDPDFAKVVAIENKP